jgi:threonine dehydrogenase-like Zn-dependent dehydrogenase
VKAIRFAAPIPTYLTTLAAGRLSRRLYVGRHACTTVGEVAQPTLPSDRWVRIRTRLGGICGSDLNVMTLKASPTTSPFSSFPFVLGHENVGDVVEVGSAVRSAGVGERVVANPLLCCEPRAVQPPCEACVSGNHSRCAHFTDGALPPGMLIGTTRGTGGSWGEYFVAHESQLLHVPDAMSDEEAVLVEPLACSVHAVRANLPAAGARVLVIGAGSIGLLTTAALSALAPAATLTVLARHEFQAEHARRLGAARVVASRGDYLAALAEAGQARLLEPIIGRPIGTGGGFDFTFVCVGGPRAVDDALRLARPGGTVVLLGNVTTLNGLDWTPVWLKELTVRGSLCYGVHAHGGAAHDAFAEAASLIASGQAPVRPLVTATYPIAEYRRAFDAALDRGTTRSVKVAFRF